MIKATPIAQQWPTATDRTSVSAAVVRSHLLANPHGISVSDIVDRAGLTKYIGDQRACVSTYLAAVWRILADLEDIGAAIEMEGKWYDVVAMERLIAARQRKARAAELIFA